MALAHIKLPLGVSRMACRCTESAHHLQSSHWRLLPCAQLAGQITDLRSGVMTPAQFAALTSPGALGASLASTQLPGKMAGPGGCRQPLKGNPVK